MESINHSVEMTYYHDYRDITDIILNDLGTPKTALKKQAIDANIYDISVQMDGRSSKKN